MPIPNSRGGLAPRVRRLALALVGVLAVSCADAGSTMEIVAVDSLQESSELAGLRMMVGGHLLTADRFGEEGRASITVPDSGVLRVDLELYEDGELISEGSFTVQMYPDSRWQLRVSRDDTDPTLPLCLGCSVKESFSIEPGWETEPEERVWVVGGVEPRDGSIST